MEKDAEILSVGKIAESARFAEEEDLSLKTDFVSSSEASYGWLPSVAFVERHRGQVPLFIDVRPVAGHRGMTVGVNESRFVMRAWGFVGRESGVRRFSQNRR